MQNFLSISWSVSRGQETYGYNICRLDDCNTGERFRTIGGGYDMVGTVAAQWLCKNYQTELQALCTTIDSKPYASTGWLCFHSFYGMHQRADGSVTIDGACGLDSVLKVARAIGLHIQQQLDRKRRNIVGFNISKGGEE